MSWFKIKPKLKAPSTHPPRHYSALSEQLLDEKYKDFSHSAPDNLPKKTKTKRKNQ